MLYICASLLPRHLYVITELPSHRNSLDNIVALHAIATANVTPIVRSHVIRSRQPSVKQFHLAAVRFCKDLAMITTWCNLISMNRFYGAFVTLYIYIILEINYFRIRKVDKTAEIPVRPLPRVHWSPISESDRECKSSNFDTRFRIADNFTLVTSISTHPQRKAWAA